MAIAPYLAMTAAEIQHCTSLPQKIAWLSCHFSPYDQGLSNLPKELPAGSLLILDDSIPIQGHEPEQILHQLTSCIQQLALSGILLDFQRPNNTHTAELVRCLSDSLPCPVCVSDLYGNETKGPVFLSPVPPSLPLAEHLAPWNNREVWMDLGFAKEVLLLTENGCEVNNVFNERTPEIGFAEESLHCHYCISKTEASVQFTLWRTEQDQLDLLKEAATLQICNAIGLYQEWRPFL